MNGIDRSQFPLSETMAEDNGYLAATQSGHFYFSHSLQRTAVDLFLAEARATAARCAYPRVAAASAGRSARWNSCEWNPCSTRHPCAKRAAGPASRSRRDAGAPACIRSGSRNQRDAGAADGHVAGKVGEVCNRARLDGDVTGGGGFLAHAPGACL